MQKKLSVPENIPLRWEAWRGFGAPELAASLAVTGVSLVAAIVYRVVSGEGFSPIIAVSIVGFTFAFCVGNLAFPFSPVAEAAALCGGFDFSLPYARQVAEKMAAGELLAGFNELSAIQFEDSIGALAGRVREQPGK